MKEPEDKRAGNNLAVKAEGSLESHANPAIFDEIQDLYSYKSAVCKIFFETLKEGKKVKGFGTGFFCDLDYKNIPFRKALFTNHHRAETIAELNDILDNCRTLLSKTTD